MTGIQESLVRLVARALPARVRDRYREEWLADLAGAEDAAVSRASVIVGALATTATINRTAPAMTGMTLGQLFAHRIRVAAGLLGSALVLAAGHYAYGGYADGVGDANTVLAVLGAIVLGAAAVLALAGLVALVGALLVAVEARRLGAALALVALPVLLAVVTVGAPSLLLGFGVLIGPMLLIAAVVLIVIGAGGHRVLPPSGRILLSAGFGAAALGACAVGILHIAVWNPLARVPGLTLDEIYAGLAAANEGLGVRAWLIAWAVLTVAGAVAFAVLAGIRRFATDRRLVAVGFLLVALTTAIGFLPAFSMGMGLADTFMTSGGDAAVTGPLLSLVGQLALVGALLSAFVRRPKPGVVAAVPV